MILSSDLHFAADLIADKADDAHPQLTMDELGEFASDASFTADNGEQLALDMTSLVYGIAVGVVAAAQTGDYVYDNSVILRLDPELIVRFVGGTGAVHHKAEKELIARLREGMVDG